MTEPQPGPYPHYPGGAGMPATPSKPPLPDTVQNAFYLMLAGAALQAVGVLVALAQLGTIRDRIRDVLARPDAPDVDVDTLMNFTVAAIVVSGLIGAGLWLWMAFVNRAGHNWARITATVFFGIATVSLLSTIAARSADSAMSGSSGTTVGLILNVVVWLIGLATIILLYNSRSNAYFKPQPHAYGYQPPGQGADYPPGPTAGSTSDFPPGPTAGPTSDYPPGPTADPPSSPGSDDMPPPR